MEAPSVRNSIKDSAKDINYHVMAYRALTRPELVQAVGYYNSTTKKKPKRGSSVTVITIIGAHY
ncbi:hypothetical protein I5L48_24525 [Pseudomonas aeruginosa]|nr:hypothetical protein [Pseudomonas aeruginosa]